MSKREHLSTMDAFSPTHQPDEGYSEDPLNPSVHNDLAAALSSLRSPADLPSWLVSNASLLPTHVKKDLTMTLLDNLPTSVIAEIVQRLNPRLYIDFVRHLPAEICLKILGYLDPVSLVAVTQTCRAWYDLALDRKIWERLYYLEGWKVILPEIEACEARVNNSLNVSIGRLSRMQSAEDAHPTKIRAILNDDYDMDMPDSERNPGFNDSISGGSIFGSPSSSFSGSKPINQPMAEMGLGSPEAKGEGKSKGKGKGKEKETEMVQRSHSSSGSGGKRKEPGSDLDLTSPAPPSGSHGPNIRSTLWQWDLHESKYRINWKYLYNMRQRLESNWELGKFKTFTFPHPNYPEEGHQECVYSLQFDSNYLVSGSRDQTMRIWNVHTRRLLRPPLRGHTGSVLCLQFDAHPDEDLLVSGSSDSNVFIWKFSTGELLQRLTRAHRESVLNVRFDHRILVTSSKDKTIKIFNRRPLNYGDVGYGGHDMVGPVPINVRRYGYEPELAAELPVKPAFTMIGRLDGHGAAVNAIQVRDKTVVSVSGDRHIKVWNWPEQVCTQTIPAHDKGIACVEYDGRRIVSGSSDYEVCIFDAPTGLKVAQLRGHAHLVRTVQAGFGDLPYSRYEDEAEAKAVDKEYFRAVEAGEVEHDIERRHRRERRVNAGSSRPEDVQAFGAKVPPGGGGGRKYGRIVSGSYDQSIIIWRRDKEGVWKPAHHLRQEEAAAAAQRDARGSRRSSSQDMSLTTTPAARPAGTQTLPSIDQMVNGGPAYAPASTRDQHGGHPRSAASYMALVDQVVPQGVAALQQALATYPVILAYHTYLQAAIEQEPSPLIRNQLRQAVTDALLMIQNGQSARQRANAARASASHADASRAANTTANTTANTAPSISAPTPSAAAEAAAEAAAANGATTTEIIQAAAAALMANPNRQQPVHRAPATPWPQAPALAPQPQGVTPAQVPLVHEHHPHIAAAENIAARVFKLQFDARKLICCSQVPTIVGWDFCNGDAELEEACRFFATVD